MAITRRRAKSVDVKCRCAILVMAFLTWSSIAPWLTSPPSMCATGIRSVSAVPVIVVTARSKDHSAVQLLNAGADDYVVRPFPTNELVARMNALLRRTALHKRLVERTVSAGALEINVPERSATFHRRPLALTRREFDLLALLVSNAGTVITRERLIDEVWDTNWYGSTKTLDVHVSSLRRKLGDDAVDSRYLHTVRGVGFRFAAPDSPS